MGQGLAYVMYLGQGLASVMYLGRTYTNGMICIPCIYLQIDCVTAINERE